MWNFCNKILICILFLFFITNSYAQYSQTNTAPGITIQEEDGTNLGRYRLIKFSNGFTTNNNDGSITITVGSSEAPPEYYLLIDDTYTLLIDDTYNLRIQ